MKKNEEKKLQLLSKECNENMFQDFIAFEINLRRVNIINSSRKKIIGLFPSGY